MTTQTSSGKRSISSIRRTTSASKKPVLQSEESGSGSGSTSVNENISKPESPLAQPVSNGETTVKKLRLSKALTIPEGTTVLDACRRMASRRVDAVLLTDSSALLSGIVTDKDIATRVIAEGLRPEHTLVSKVMTRNPIFVTSDSLAIEALEKMVQGKFRHLPVVENGEVIALLDITKCLYDAISRMEKAAEQGSALAAAVEGVDRQWGGSGSGNFSSAPFPFIETMRERMFKPALSTIITENSKVALVSPSDPVFVASKRMRDLRVNSVIIAAGNKIHGILTSKDILMRVVAQNLSPELTLVEKVMTPSPECASMETTILDALHIMHDGKFLHLPVLDKDGFAAACVDVLQITHAAISTVENSSGAVNDMANTMMQKFWDSALTLDPHPPEDYETNSEMSTMLINSEGADTGKQSVQSQGLVNAMSSFAFKFQDRKGRVHRFSSTGESFEEVMSVVMERCDVADSGLQIMYQDDEGDKVLISRDSDLVAAVAFARSLGHKVLRLHLDFTETMCVETVADLSEGSCGGGGDGCVWLRTGVVAGAIVLTSIGLLVYLKRSKK
uniref:CBS domain-containing protein CBSCBSPB2 n=1 Tax=Noccaea caerulescens TaxID=107243 RepID=A0A1J3EQI8_NOCCA